MLRVWSAPETRPTRDIDLLGFVKNDIEHLETIVQVACNVDVENDGLHFDAASVTDERIKEDADYEGIRIRFTGLLENARIPMQIDVGFGGAVYPAAQEMRYPTILDFPAPRLRMYPRETVVAEKHEAMVFLGTVNSRMKDFYDIWLLARQFEFSGTDLAAAISKTFEKRGTTLDANPIALTETFTDTETAPKSVGGVHPAFESRHRTGHARGDSGTAQAVRHSGGGRDHQRPKFHRHLAGGRTMAHGSMTGSISGSSYASMTSEHLTECQTTRRVQVQESVIARTIHGATALYPGCTANAEVL